MYCMTETRLLVECPPDWALNKNNMDQNGDMKWQLLVKCVCMQNKMMYTIYSCIFSGWARCFPQYFPRAVRLCFRWFQKTSPSTLNTPVRTCLMAWDLTRPCGEWHTSAIAGEGLSRPWLPQQLDVQDVQSVDDVSDKVFLVSIRPEWNRMCYEHN